LPVTFDPATGVAQMQHVERWDPRVRELAQSPHSEDAACVLGIDGTSFTINGRKTFLLGASYYRAVGAPDEFILRDLDDLRKLGFNWIFHNGSPSPPERFPNAKRRSFDMRSSQGRLMDQLDAIERQFLERAKSCMP
jgi:hypothetical protein